MRRYKYYSANKKKIVALTVAVVLMSVLLMGAMTSWFTDFNPFCWFGHEYNEAGVCIKCDHAIEAEPNEEENVTPEQTPGDTSGATPSATSLAYTPAVASTSDDLNSEWIECESWEEACPLCGETSKQDDSCTSLIFLESGDELWENLDLSLDIHYILTTDDILTCEDGVFLIEKDRNFYYSDSTNISINVPGVYRLATLRCDEATSGGCGFSKSAVIEVVASTSDEGLEWYWTDATWVENGDFFSEHSGFEIKKDDSAAENFCINGTSYIEFFEDTGDGDAFMILSSSDVFSFSSTDENYWYEIYIEDASALCYFVQYGEVEEDILINVPGVYEMSVVVWTDTGDMCLTYSEPFTVFIECEPGIPPQKEIIVSYVVNDKIAGMEVTYAGYAPEVDYDSIINTIPAPEGYKIVGWMTEDGAPYEREALTSNTTLRAVLEQITFPVSFIVDNDYVGQIVLTYGDSLAEDFNVVELFSLDLAEGYTVGAFTYADGTKYEGQAFTQKTSLYANVEVIKLKVSLVVDGEVYKELNVDYGTILSDALKQNGISLIFTAYDKAVLDAEVVEDIQVLGEVTAAGNLLRQTWFQYILVAIATIVLVVIVLSLRKKFRR